MIKLYSQRGKIAYGIKQFVVQTIEDLKNSSSLRNGKHLLLLKLIKLDI